ncbi:MAG TPA: hypothetical protein VFN50_08030 [Acidimicrobiales bacterium]|nr:hypothetical protein [Acidimicrobiales bacterium]
MEVLEDEDDEEEEEEEEEEEAGALVAGLELGGVVPCDVALEATVVVPQAASPKASTTARTEPDRGGRESRTAGRIAQG